MTAIATRDASASVRLGVPLVLVPAAAGLAVLAFAPGPRILFMILLAPVVTAAIAFGLVVALWALLLGFAAGTVVLPPVGAPIVNDSTYAASAVMYLIEGTAFAVVGAIARAALRSGAPSVESTVPPERAPRPGPSPCRSRLLAPLTPRELEVLRAAGSGRGVSDLAAELCVSPNTVKTHLAHCYDKLGAHCRAEAIARALRDGWLEPSDLEGSLEDTNEAG